MTPTDITDSERANTASYAPASEARQREQAAADVARMLYPVFVEPVKWRLR